MKDSKQLKKKSIFAKVFVPLIVMTVIQAVILLGMYSFADVFGSLNADKLNAFNEKVIFRRSQIQNELSYHWPSLNDFITKISSNTIFVIDTNGGDISNIDDELSSSYGSVPLSELLLRQHCDDIIEYMTNSVVDGVYIILNKSSGDHSALFIRSEKDGTNSNSDLFIAAAPPLAKTYLVNDLGIKNNYSKPTMSLSQNDENNNFYYQPYIAYNNVARSRGKTTEKHYGYWGYTNFGNGIKSVTYSVPLIYNNKAYGVMGIEISAQHILNKFNEYPSSDNDIFILGMSDGNSLTFDNVVITNKLYNKAFSNTLTVTASTSNYNNTYVFNNAKNYDMYGNIEYLNIYDEDSYFASNSWVVIGMTDAGNLYAFNSDLRMLFAFTIVVVVILGIIFTAYVSLNIYKPIVRLTNEVKVGNTQNNLYRSKIYEVDQLIDEIEKVNTQLAQIEQKEKEKIEFERDHDILTHLINRRAFHTALTKLLHSPKKIKTAALMMLDLDDLKHVNDTYGHNYGDIYLSSASNMLKEFCSQQTIVSRYGGDEFVIFIYGYDNREPIYNILKKINNAIEQCYIELPPNKNYKVNFSAGYAWYPDDSFDIDQLLKYADFAMYGVKQTTKASMKEFNMKEYNSKKQGK